MLLTDHSSRLEAGLSSLTTMLLMDHLMSRTMGQNRRDEVPAWVWGLAFAAGEASLQYNESMVPDDLWQAWKRRDDAGQHQLVLDLLKTCKPIEAHHFLHCVGNYGALTAEFNVVLRRPDCNRATALMYFAYFWLNYYDGRREWMDDEQHELMSYIRTRAWNGGYKIRKFDVPELTLHELEEMREVLVDKKDHPFSLPASFVAMSKKEELFHKLCEKFIPRKIFAN
jgi:hypothetical protein